VKKRPNVRQVVLFVKGDVDIAGLQMLVQRARIVAQNFRIAHTEPHGRRATKIGA